MQRRDPVAARRRIPGYVSSSIDSASRPWTRAKCDPGHRWIPRPNVTGRARPAASPPAVSPPAASRPAVPPPAASRPAASRPARSRLAEPSTSSTRWPARTSRPPTTASAAAVLATICTGEIAVSSSSTRAASTRRRAASGGSAVSSRAALARKSVDVFVPASTTKSSSARASGSLSRPARTARCRAPQSVPSPYGRARCSSSQAPSSPYAPATGRRSARWRWARAHTPSRAPSRRR